MRHLLAAALAAALALPAAAETIRASGPLTSTVTLAEGLSAHPGFAGFLRGEALAIRDDYAARARDAGGGWALELTDRLTFVNENYASVLRHITRRATAGRVRSVEALTWGGGDFVRLDAWFDPGPARDEALAAIAYRIRKGIRDHIWKRAIPASWRDELLAATNPDTVVLPNFTLAPSTVPGKAAGLSFHFNPGEIAPGDRPETLTLPYALFAGWLNPAGRALFGGELSP